MKFTVSFLFTCISTASAFAFTAKPTFHVTSQSSSALFDSRSRQKIALRSQWIKSRGLSDTSSTASDSGTSGAGLMKNEHGLEYVKLVDSKTGATSEVYLFGGVVTSYKDGDGTEYVAVRPDSKMDGSKPISGGLCHCWPQFGPGAIQQHGFARNVNWSVKSMTDTTVDLELAPNEYTKGIWDKPFLCNFSVSLEADKLSTKMKVKNSGDEAFDFQAAIHSYFTVSSLDNLKISGSFKGKQFLNKLVDEMQTEERDVITISEEYDRVYKGVNDPVLEDTGTGKSLSVLNTQGYEDTVIWNPYGNEGMGYNNFVCVESVKFDPVTLEGGSTWVGDMALKPSS
jgi:glucose-6-phosphate 1-epimerase